MNFTKTERGRLRLPGSCTHRTPVAVLEQGWQEDKSFMELSFQNEYLNLLRR